MVIYGLLSTPAPAPLLLQTVFYLQTCHIYACSYSAYSNIQGTKMLAIIIFETQIFATWSIERNKYFQDVISVICICCWWVQFLFLEY